MNEAAEVIPRASRCGGTVRVTTSPERVHGALRWSGLLRDAECEGAAWSGPVTLFGGPDSLARGDDLEVIAQLAPPTRLWNESDPRPREARQKTARSGGIVDARIVRRGTGVLAAIDRVRARVRARIEATFPEDVAPMARALVLGESDLSPDDDIAMRASGLAHLLAVSGMHPGDRRRRGRRRASGASRAHRAARCGARRGADRSSCRGPPRVGICGVRGRRRVAAASGVDAHGRLRGPRPGSAAAGSPRVPPAGRSSRWPWGTASSPSTSPSSSPGQRRPASSSSHARSPLPESATPGGAPTPRALGLGDHWPPPFPAHPSSPALPPRFRSAASRRTSSPFQSESRSLFSAVPGARAPRLLAGGGSGGARLLVAAGALRIVRPDRASGFA